MKAPSIFLTLTLSLAAPLTLAQLEPDHQAHHPDAAVPGETVTMQQQLDRMQMIVDRLAETANPAERHKLRQEHRQAMLEARSMMGAMQDGMGMKGSMPDGEGGMGMMGGGMGMMGGGMGMMGGGSGMMGGGSGMMSRQPGMMPMMQRMEAMLAGVDEILHTRDPRKRHELMQQHRRQMQDAMAMMRGIQQGSGMGMGMMGSMPMMGHAGMVEAFWQMDKRLDLMQQMLEQLMMQQD